MYVYIDHYSKVHLVVKVHVLLLACASNSIYKYLCSLVCVLMCCVYIYVFCICGHDVTIAG